jgi:uncharacterized protein YjiS (DUF1127 family)
MMTMAYYGTQDFDRMVAARNSFALIPAYELEFAARRMRAQALAAATRKAVTAIKTFLAARPAPTVVTGYKLTDLQKAQLAQGAAIAHTTDNAFNVVKGFFATRPETPEVNTFKMSEQDQARMAQAEAIADAVIAVSTFFSKAAKWLYAPIQAWRIQLRTREELDGLDDRALADIGLTRGDIRRVAAGLWVPENRTAQNAFTAPVAASNINKPQIAA